MKQAHSFDDVLLVPKHSDIESRFSVKIGNDLDKNIYLEFNNDQFELSENEIKFRARINDKENDYLNFMKEFKKNNK